MSHVETTAPNGAHKLYFAAWRWHFYAGLYVIPFLVMTPNSNIAPMIILGQKTDVCVNR